MLVIWNNTKRWWQLICTRQEPITFFYRDEEGFRGAAVQSAFQQWVEWLFINHSLPITFREKIPEFGQTGLVAILCIQGCVSCQREAADRSVGRGFVLGFSPVGSGSPRHGRMDGQQLVLPGLFTINQSAKTLNTYFANLVNSLSSIYILKMEMCRAHSR